MTKKDMIASLIEAYETTNRPINEQQLPKVWKRLMNKSKETLQRYIDYVANGKDKKHNSAFVLAHGTGILFTVIIKHKSGDTL